MSKWEFKLLLKESDQSLNLVLFDSKKNRAVYPFMLGLLFFDLLYLGADSLKKEKAMNFSFHASVS